MTIQELLQQTVNLKSSDLHISTQQPPMIRHDGELTHLTEEVLDEDTVLQMIADTMTERQQQLFKDNLELDYAYRLPKVARFRVNAFNQQRGPSIAFRTIPNTIPSLTDLGFAGKYEHLLGLPNGVILVTGPTGSGKSTTLAAMIDHINTTTRKHIITIEDPVEFTHQCKQCLINQREVEHDTKSFGAALRSALREDPDIILVGEMRDLETIRLALTAAETGHLVFATLHTNSAAKTIDRIIDVFPAAEKEMVRAMLAESLRAVISQTLVKRTGGGRVAAQEVMICNHAIRNLIRENKIPQIYSTIQTGLAQGMITMEQALQRLANDNLIDTLKPPLTTR